MSGGHFEYIQYRLREPAEEIERMAATNLRTSEYGEEGFPLELSEKTLAVFREAALAIHRAEIYLQRIDWLVSGDDGEDTFHKRLAEELAALSG